MSNLHPSMKRLLRVASRFGAHVECPLCSPGNIPQPKKFRINLSQVILFSYPEDQPFRNTLNYVYRHIRYAHRLRHTDAVQAMLPLLVDIGEARLVNLDHRISKQMQGKRP